MELTTQLEQLTPRMWLFLNTNGAVQNSTGLSAAGGVLRDEAGKLLSGYNRHLGKCSVIEAKLWSILDGLLLLQKQGYDNIIIQSDNLKVVEALCGNQVVGLRKQMAREVHF